MPHCPGGPRVDARRRRRRVGRSVAPPGEAAAAIGVCEVLAQTARSRLEQAAGRLARHRSDSRPTRLGAAAPAQKEPSGGSRATSLCWRQARAERGVSGPFARGRGAGGRRGRPGRARPFTDRAASASNGDLGLQAWKTRRGLTRCGPGPDSGRPQGNHQRTPVTGPPPVAHTRFWASWGTRPASGDESSASVAARVMSQAACRVSAAVRVVRGALLAPLRPGLDAQLMSSRMAR